MGPQDIAAIFLLSSLGALIAALLGWLGWIQILGMPRPLLGWVEPVPGEEYFLDGRLAVVVDCDEDGVTVEIGIGSITVSHRYWRSRARPAATDARRLLATKAQEGGHHG